MTIPEHDRERLREEEAMREALRREHRRQRQPRLLAMAAVWTLILTALALVSAHFHG
jgi:predicted nucleic acid-binding Zn ribbon protein